MKLTEQEAIAIATKVLKDINFWDTDLVLPKAQYLDEVVLKDDPYEEPHWLVSFSYGMEDFGEDVARVFIKIDDDSLKVGKLISFRGGLMQIEYDETNDKYVKVNPSKR